MTIPAISKSVFQADRSHSLREETGPFGRGGEGKPGPIFTPLVFACFVGPSPKALGELRHCAVKSQPLHCPARSVASRLSRDP